MLTRDGALAGRYTIEAEVGRGGMARVYRATDTVLGRTVAVKVLAEEYASDPTFVERFRREARSAARLNHPNVVSVFDTGSDGPVHFIVMEFVEGRTLADVLAEEGPLPPERAAGIARDVATALSFAHDEGLVHRDVKPANVMITPGGQVKVMDFGIARLATSHTITQASTVFGTAAYLAPEQAQGHRVDGRADIYALGVVLYEMLAGRVPFAGETPFAVASKHVLEEPEPPSTIRPDVPPALEAVVMRAMAKDPEARFADAADMAAAIDGALGAGPSQGLTLPIAAAPTVAAPDRTAVMTPVARSHAAPPRRPRWWIPVVLAVLGLLLLAAFLPSLLSGEDKPGAGATPKHSATQQHSNGPTTAATSAPPATSAPTSAPPATTAPPPPGTPTVDDAIASVAALVQDAQSANAIDDHTAKDVQHALDDAARHYDDGDADKALEDISKAQDKVSEAIDKGDTTSEVGTGIIAALDQVAAAIQASPPVGTTSDGGDPHGPGKDKGHGHGHDEEHGD